MLRQFSKNLKQSKQACFIQFLTFFLILLSFISIPSQSYAQRIKLNITASNFQPQPIAITPFTGVTFSAQERGKEIASIISNDLRRSGVFQPIPEASFLERLSDFDIAPKFQNWQQINADTIVQGRVTLTPDQRTKAEVRLWEVSTGQQLMGQQYVAQAQNWRRIAHIIADDIHKTLTGEIGFFDTRIVFVDESGPKDNRVKRLAIMDQDGANAQYLTRGNALVLTPRFNPKRQEIAYMSFDDSQPRIYLLNIETGQRELVGRFPAMTFAPSFTPDGHQIALSLSQDGNANIYTFDVGTGRTTRLTNTASIDTSPSYSPDGRRIVFESDRGGSQQLYIMDENGGNPKRISFGNGQYGTPTWSPRGDLIAFTKRSGGKFMIGVMKPDGSSERILTEGFHNEAPNWAPNGRALTFFRDTPGANGGPKLWMSDIYGRVLEQIPTPNFASDPAWSPTRK